MSDDKDKKPPEEGEERTVFMPLPPAGGEAAPVAPAPAGPAAAPESKAEVPAAAEQPPAADPPAAAAEPSPPGASPAPPTAFAPREAARPIRVGDVLNHIFEVKSFLARGGMGEVFEGCNVNTDERVAIKVMLPALAADEKVVAMFRKEARTLTKLQHEALVSYRVLAQEPQIGVLYIVTEFIEGVSLSEVLGKVERTPEELAGLLKRLAAGLSAAHRLGAIHRDMSPDNVLLPGGDVHQAKIIDFGIAKDLDASSATIVGDGFAGKLNYVAPEQLGDYGREVGPWTDVYSLALVILAVAQGRSVDMSGSLVDAIDKRRKGPDLSAAPDSLRPLLEAMLRPDPKERLRSMDEVLARLGGAPAEAPGPAAPAAPAEPRRGGSRALIVGLVIAAALAVAAASWYVLSRAGGGLIPVPRDEVSGNIVAPAADPTETARNAINSVLPSVSCTWLDIASIGGGGDGVAIAMRGVAGDGEAARRELASALASAGVENARLDFADVAPILPAGCAALDTYRQVRASSGRHLSIAQPRFEMAMQPPGLPYAGSIAANAVIDLDLGDAATDFAIAGIEPSGAITALIPSRTDFQAAVAQSVNGRPIADQGNGRYRLNVDLDHQGWSGLILVSGQGPFVPDLIAPPVGARGPAWQQQFLAAASQGNWRVEMVWFESVDREGNDAASGMPAPEPAPDGGKLP